MRKDIVKAEILFSRQCPLSCSYCAMKSERRNTRTVDEWINGMQVLKKLGCSFCAFYGAEPLTEFNKLRHVVGACENMLDIDTTIITSGMVSDFDKKIMELHWYGARSLSMSYDPLPIDTSSKKKSENAIEHLTRFNRLADTRDVAAIATLTAQNFREFPRMVREMTERGIWSFFDFIHTDRGQVGSKCKTTSEDLMIKPEHYEDVHRMLVEVLGMKTYGALVHITPSIVNTFSDLMVRGNMYSWTCSYQEPSWVTIDCDGMVYPCDDFTGTHKPTDMLNLHNDWDLFAESRTLAVINADCKCCWGTHIGAHLISSGIDYIGDYVHGK